MQLRCQIRRSFSISVQPHAISDEASGLVEGYLRFAVWSHKNNRADKTIGKVDKPAVSQ